MQSMEHGVPARIWTAIRDMGAGAEPEINKASKAMFAPLLESGDGVVQKLDIPYGANQRQTLDVYTSAGLRNAPVVLYVPGGGFTGGDKRQDDFFFANIGRFFAKRGVVCVIMNYRLAPEFTWPSAARDVEQAISWIGGSIAEYGGAADRPILFGHSAGAAHAASYLYDPDMNGGAHVRAAVLGSGLYILRSAEMRANVAQYFGSDEATFERRSAISHVSVNKTPVLLCVAEFDPSYLATPTFELAAALTRRDGRPPAIVRADGHNHFSYISSIGSPDDRFSSALFSFVRANTGDAP
jgi:acetyl esterase/lipase